MIKKIIVLCMLLSIVGCSQTTTKEEKTYEITIPLSLTNYSGNAADDVPGLIDDYNEEKKYCQEAKAGDNDSIILVSTQKQINKYIKDNNKLLKDTLESKFYNTNDIYKFEGSKDFKTASIYCDEKQNPQNFFQVESTIFTVYGLNHILTEKDSNWGIDFKVINVHSGNIVSEANIPDEEFSLQGEMWAQSY